MTREEWLAREFPPTALHADRRHLFLPKVEVAEDERSCWIWIGAVSGRAGVPRAGYGKFHIRDGERFRQAGAHRIALEMATGTVVPADLEVMHACDVCRCVRPSHLSIGTHADNMLDAARKGRRAQKLDEQTVRAILASPDRVRDLAARYGLTTGAVSQIRTGKRWTHIDRTGLVRERKPPFAPDPGMSRNDAILAAREHGETLATIGARYGITRERVRQIVARRAA